MNKVIAFIRKHSFAVAVVTIVAAYLGTLYCCLAYMKADAAVQREAEARLEARYKYTIMHWHAGRYSYAVSYYTDAYEIDGPFVKFTDHEGRSILVDGDVTVVENGKSH